MEQFDFPKKIAPPLQVNPSNTLLHRTSKMSPSTIRYNIDWYVNGQNTFTSYNMTAAQAYDHAIPGEALIPLTASRWHVMMRQPALKNLADLKPGETLKVCYQDQHELPGYDTEVITITRAIVP